MLLYDLDPKWSARVQEEVIDLASLVGQALDNTGHPTTPVRVTDSDLDSALSGYDPQEYLVFNWCESLPGLHNSECNVVQFLEQYGYTFTGATSATLELTSDKCRVKRLLDCETRGVFRSFSQIFEVFALDAGGIEKDQFREIAGRGRGIDAVPVPA